MKQLYNSRIVNAGIWSLGGHGVSQVLRLASSLIMTRLLLPEMFGIMVIANMIITGLSLFSDLGLGQNIVRSKRGDESHFLNTIWAVQIIRGVIIWTISIVIGLSLYFLNKLEIIQGSTVYHEPILPAIIIAISFSAVILGFESTKLAVATRNYEQKKLALIGVLTQLLSIAGMIFWVIFIERTIWALVIGNWVACIVKVFLTHKFLTGLPNRWEWEAEALKEILHFGKWVFLSSLITFTFKNGDKILLGGMISPTLLGIYSISLIMINVFQTLISKLINATIYPKMSSIYHKEEKSLKDVYYKFRLAMDSFIFILVGFLVVAGNFIISSLYDDRYEEAGVVLQILALILLSSRYMVTERYLLAIGKPSNLTILNIIRAVSLYIIVPTGFYFYGFYGALWGIVLSYFSSIPVALYFKIKYNIFDFKKEIVVIPLFVVSVALSVAVMLLIDETYFDYWKLLWIQY